MAPAVERLFRLTRREYFADFFITPPITAGLMIMSLRSAAWWWPITFAGGLIAWTFYEYAVHRWVSHRFGFLKKAHFLHHARQRDYIAVHPAFTVALYAAFWLTVGVQSSAFMVGFSVGYVAYSVAHTLFHYAPIREGSVLFAAKRRHALHHKYDDVNFGVTVDWFDRLFGTIR